MQTQDLLLENNALLKTLLKNQCVISQVLEEVIEKLNADFSIEKLEQLRNLRKEIAENNFK